MTAFSQGELELSNGGSGAVTTVLVSSSASDDYPVVIAASIECDTASPAYVELAWRDPSLILYRCKRVTGAATWKMSGMQQIPPVPACDLVAIVSGAGATTGRILVDGEVVRDQ